MASWLGMGACVPFPFSIFAQYLAWTWVSLMHAAQSLWVHMSVSPVLSERLLFPWCHPTLLDLTIFLPPLAHSVLNVFDGDIPFMTECSKICYFLYIIQLWVSVLVLTYWERKHLWLLLNKAIYKYRRMPFWGITLYLCSFSRTISFAFLLDPWTM